MLPEYGNITKPFKIGSFQKNLTVYFQVCSMNQNKHYIFSDESGYDGDNRFASLAKVSGTYEHSLELHNKLKDILARHTKEEIKFKDVHSHKTKSIATEFLSTSFDFLNQSKIKIHVIVWDKLDSRHNIPNRCDIENLKRMYYHNMKALLKSWNTETSWSFYPDEFTAIDWENDIIKYIENTRLNPANDMQQKLFDVFRDVQFPTVKSVRELDSKDYPIIQLADLYAGLVRTSRAESDKYSLWHQLNALQCQPSLFEEDLDVDVSKTLKPKFEVMREFHEKAKKYRLGVNFSDSKYFKTFHDKSNLSIWHYEPQSEFDKAPIKIKK